MSIFDEYSHTNSQNEGQNLHPKIDGMMTFCIIPHTMLTLEVAMLLISLIYPIVQDSGSLTCLALQWNPPLMVTMGVKVKIGIFPPLLGSSGTPFT